MSTIVKGNGPQLREFLPEYTGHGDVLLSLWSTPEAFAASIPASKKDAWSEQAWDGDGEQRGTRDMAEAIKLCLDGWPEGAATAERLRDRINAANPTGPRVIRYDVAGAYPSVPRALAGNPLNMRRVDSARLRRRPVLTLISDATVQWGVAAQVLANRAAVVAAVVDAIEASGFACQVVTVAASGRSGGGPLWCCATETKESSAPADIGRLAFALGHPSYFRRMCFAAATTEKAMKPLGNGLGSPQPVESTPELAARSVYVIPSPQIIGQHFRTEDAAATAGLKAIIDSLVAQGCPAFPAQEARAA